MCKTSKGAELTAAGDLPNKSNKTNHEHPGIIATLCLTSLEGPGRRNMHAQAESLACMSHELLFYQSYKFVRSASLTAPTLQDAPTENPKNWPRQRPSCCRTPRRQALQPRRAKEPKKVKITERTVFLTQDGLLQTKLVPQQALHPAWQTSEAKHALPSMLARALDQR